jgi:hypothetical protein
LLALEEEEKTEEEDVVEQEWKGQVVVLRSVRCRRCSGRPSPQQLPMHEEEEGGEGGCWWWW